MRKRYRHPQLPVTNGIKARLACTLCSKVHDLPEVNYLEVGLTDYGIQVWCTKHNVSVAHLRIQRPRIRKKLP